MGASRANALEFMVDGVNERRKHEATESALHKPIPRRGGYHEKLRLSNIGAAPHPPAPELNRPTPTHASCPLAVCTSHMCPQTLPQTYQGTKTHTMHQTETYHRQRDPPA